MCRVAIYRPPWWALSFDAARLVCVESCADYGDEDAGRDWAEAAIEYGRQQHDREVREHERPQ